MTNDLATEMMTGENTSFQDFDDFLQDKFMEDEPESVGCKDDFQDNFDNWLQQLDADVWTRYGNLFGLKQRAVGQKEIVAAVGLKDLK